MSGDKRRRSAPPPAAPASGLAAEHDDAEQFRQRATWAVLVLVCGLGWIGSAVAILVPAPQGHARWLPSAWTLAISVLLTAMPELHRRGVRWATGVAALLLVLFVIPGLPDGTFAQSLPQAIWVPTVTAFALASLPWALLVAAATAAAIAAFHPSVPALRMGTPLFTAVGMLAMLVVARMVQDRLHRLAISRRAQVHRLALYDELTGLPNRRLLADRLTTSLAHAARRGTPVAVLFVDLDRFKEVNDTLGHAQGDALLVEAVARLRGCIRASDTLARFGGDEFTVVLPDATSRAAIDRITGQMLAQLAEPFRAGDEQVHLSASIGVAVYPDDGRTAEDLMKHADQALYLAKDAGRNQCCYFTRALQDEAEQRLRLAHDLRGALAGGELRVHYQPIVELRTGEVHKAEALLRWQHPRRGAVSPAVFIPVAEATGLIHELGDWVFREAAAQAKAWRAGHDPRFQISVNRSPAQFRGAAARATPWAAHLRAEGLPGDAIVLEITEGLLLDDTRGVAEQLDELREAGIGVSLDDFGTGYSALSYLHRYAIDYVKIDQSFVRSLDASSKNLPLCKAIIVMAHELGMKVVAEGVETAAQRALLRDAGCDYAQGYLFARAMPPADLEALLRAGPLRVDGEAAA